MRRRTVLVGAAVTVALGIGGWSARRAIPSAPPAAQAVRPVPADPHLAGGRVEVDVAEYSPSGPHDPVDRLLAEHGSRAVVHDRRLRS